MNLRQKLKTTAPSGHNMLRQFHTQMPVSSIIKPAVSMPCLALAQNPTTRMRRKSGGEKSNTHTSNIQHLFCLEFITFISARVIFITKPLVSQEAIDERNNHTKESRTERAVEILSRWLPPRSDRSAFVVSDVLQCSKSKHLISHQLHNGATEHPGAFEGPAWTIWEKDGRDR